MSDIVERLRAHVSPEWGSAGNAMREAADELERLRAALAQQEQSDAVPEWRCECDALGRGDPTQTCGDCPRDYGHKVASPQRTALLQPDVKPVAWMSNQIGLPLFVTHAAHEHPQSDAVRAAYTIPLYTHPPQQCKPHNINYFRVQEIAAKLRLNYNDFSAALREYIGDSNE